MSSTGKAATKQPATMGEYRRVEGVTAKTRPVWRRGANDCYFFYNSYCWVIGPDYKVDRGWIKSEDSGLTDIPCTRWKYYDGKHWKSDAKMTVVGE